MKRFLFIIALVLFSCSKEEDEPTVITKADLLGTWQVYSINGSTDLDVCDLEEQLNFTNEALIMTGSYWDDLFAKENCRVFTSEKRYKIEDGRLRIEYDGISYFTSFKDRKTLEINTRFDDISNYTVYKKN